MFEASVEVHEAMIGTLTNIFQMPWKVEHDWGYEVIDKNGSRVAQFRTPELAAEMIAMAVSYENKLADRAASMEKMLTDVIGETPGRV